MKCPNAVNPMASPREDLDQHVGVYIVLLRNYESLRSCPFEVGLPLRSDSFGGCGERWIRYVHVGSFSAGRRS